MTAREQSLMESVARLREALSEPESVLVRDAAIKRFEFTFELLWKTLQMRLRQDGWLGRSPREVLREAFRAGLITDDEQWMRMLEDRNLSVHTYDELLAQEVYGRLPSYLKLIESAAQQMKLAP